MVASTRLRWTFLLLLVLVPACRPMWVSRADRVRPIDLPRLDGLVVTVATRWVESPDGRVVTVRGRYDLRITRGGARTVFAAPVRVHRRGDALLVQSGDRPATLVPLASIEQAEVLQRRRTSEPGTRRRLADGLKAMPGEIVRDIVSQILLCLLTGGLLCR